MPDIKQYEPLWGSWYVDKLIGEGSFGKVYRVKREEFGKTYYSAVKLISIPQNDADYRQMKSEGLDDASARSYFQAFVADIIQEIDLMSEFRGNSNIVSFEDHKVIESQNGAHWDILIRMELLTSLTEHSNDKPLSTNDIIKLGIHICRALELCAVKKTIHRDIKPDNIFISQYGDFKLGDFGIARQIERTMSGLSKKGTYTYMAPEVFKGDDYGASVDTYSLGIVLYRFLNGGRTPFLPDFPNPILPRDRDESLQRRMRGEALPPITGVALELNDIVLRACSFDRSARFASATEMREALEKLSTGGKHFAPVATPIFSVDSEQIDSTVGLFATQANNGYTESSTSASEGVFSSASQTDEYREATSVTEGVWDSVENDTAVTEKSEIVSEVRSSKAKDVFINICGSVLALGAVVFLIVAIIGGEFLAGILLVLPYLFASALCFSTFRSSNFNFSFAVIAVLALLYSLTFSLGADIQIPWLILFVHLLMIKNKKIAIPLSALFLALSAVNIYFTGGSSSNIVFYIFAFGLSLAGFLFHVGGEKLKRFSTQLFVVLYFIATVLTIAMFTFYGLFIGLCSMLFAIAVIVTFVPEAIGLTSKQQEPTKPAKPLVLAGGIAIIAFILIALVINHNTPEVKLVEQYELQKYLISASYQEAIETCSDSKYYDDYDFIFFYYQDILDSGYEIDSRAFVDYIPVELEYPPENGSIVFITAFPRAEVIPINDKITMYLGIEPYTELNPITVPNLFNTEYQAGKTALSNLRLDVSGQVYELSDEVLNGNIIRTEPASGELLNPGDSIWVVVSAGSGIKLSVTDVTLTLNSDREYDNSFTLRVNGTTDGLYSSDNVDVATVDYNGLVTAVATGTARIIVDYLGQRAVCVVRIREKGA
jgi:serine/threonine protein kinase